jgi:uncharacterized repeat protein (TIGR03803 family)
MQADVCRTRTKEATMNARFARLLPCSLAAALIVLAAAPRTVGAQAAGDYFQILSFTPDEADTVRGTLHALPGGSIVGTASAGGANGLGTVYVLRPSEQSVEVLHSFAGRPSDGAEPWAGVVDDGQGGLWGTTRGGGAQDGGTIYRIANGRYKVVHMFGKDAGGGRAPLAGLTLASDGMLYGVAREGGSSGGGTVFRLEVDGSVTTLWDFANGEPATPGGRLMQASDGLLYGMTSFGGTSGAGTIFSLALDGSGHRILHSFSGSDGFDGAGGLIEATDGHLYGTTSLGGANGAGAAFRIDRDGSNFVLLHSFSHSRDDGWGPFDELFETSPGVFVGTTAFGGKADAGTVFQMLATGEVTVLHAFTGAARAGGYVDGSAPFGTLTPAGPDSLVGTTASGGAAGAGTVFKMRVN